MRFFWVNCAVMRGESSIYHGLTTGLGLFLVAVIISAALITSAWSQSNFAGNAEDPYDDIEDWLLEDPDWLNNYEHEAAGVTGPAAQKLQRLNNDDPDAKYEIGKMYEEGEWVRQNYEEAAKWYYSAGIAGHKDAQYRLARLYDQGFGVPQDYPRAVRWYQLAANQKHRGAKYFLSRILETRSEKIKASRAFLRSKPKQSLTSEILAELTHGNEVHVFHQSGEWVQIYFPSNDMWGWIRTTALRQNDPSLFGISLGGATRSQMHTLLTNSGLDHIGGGDPHWHDIYDSVEALDGTTQLTLAYVPPAEYVAFAEYLFPAPQNEEKIKNLVQLIQGKYGPPDESPPKNLVDGPQEWRWEQGGSFIRVTATQGQEAYLTYEIPDRMHQLKEATKEYKQRRLRYRAEGQYQAY